MAHDWSLHPARIRSLVRSDNMTMDAPTHEWIDALEEALNYRDEDAVVAWTHAQEEHDGDAVFKPDTFTEVFTASYREKWETKAEFARWVAEDECDMGDVGEGRGRRWFLEHYGKFIDWDAFAESPQLVSTYSLVMLDAENSRVVHAFKDDELKSS